MSPCVRARTHGRAGGGVARARWGLEKLTVIPVLDRVVRRDLTCPGSDHGGDLAGDVVGIGADTEQER